VTNDVGSDALDQSDASHGSDAADAIDDADVRGCGACTADETCADAARVMCERDVGSVPVVDPQGAVVGMITDRDVCIAAYKQGRPLVDLDVKDCMSKNVISVHPNDDVKHVQELMEVNQIRRIPVIGDDGILSGIISLADLAQIAAESEIAEVVEAVSEPHA